MACLTYNVDEVADIIGMSANFVRGKIKDGTLQRIPNTGRVIRISAAEVEAVWGVATDSEAVAS